MTHYFDAECHLIGLDETKIPEGLTEIVPGDLVEVVVTKLDGHKRASARYTIPAELMEVSSCANDWSFEAIPDLSFVWPDGTSTDEEVIEVIGDPIGEESSSLFEPQEPDENVRRSRAGKKIQAYVREQIRTGFVNEVTDERPDAE